MKPFSKKADVLGDPISPYEPAEERGKKEVSKYDPEYEWLVKLIQVISKTAPEAIPEIKNLSLAYPFVTIDDVGDLAAKIWTLATTKYDIPRAWLVKQLPEKTGSLKVAANSIIDFSCEACGHEFSSNKFSQKNRPKCPVCKSTEIFSYRKLPKKADLWPAQEQAGDMLSHDHNSLSYNPLQEADTSVCGPRPDDVEKVSKKLNINDVVKMLNSKEPQVAGLDMTSHTIKLIDGTVLTFDEAVQKALQMDKESVFSGAEFSNTEFNTNPTLDNGPFSSPEDHGAKPQKQPFPNTNWVPADDEDQDEQPWSNVASSLRPFSKKASPDSRYWIAPDGTEFPAPGAGHGAWIMQNKNILTKYGIKITALADIYSQMFNSGWTRISNEPAGSGFQIEVGDVSKLPTYLDNFIAKHFSEGETILIGTQQNSLSISDPFPSIQKRIRDR